MRSLIALWLVGLLTHCSLAQSKKPQLRSGKSQNAATAQQVPGNPPASLPSNAQPASQPSNPETSSRDSKSDEKPTKHNPIVWLTGAIAFFALVQSGAMIFQYCAMRKQASYMRHGLQMSLRSANAAKKSADSLINSERAWIITELNWVNESSLAPKIQQLNRGDGATEPFARLKLTLHNSGKTPAWITGTWVRHDVTSATVADPKQDQKMKLESGPEPLAAGEKTFAQLDFVCPGISTTPKPDTVIVFGITEYVDCFGEKRTTCFGYKFTVRGDLDRIPDDSYNRFT